MTPELPNALPSSIETYCPTGVKIFHTIPIQNMRFFFIRLATFGTVRNIPWSTLKDLHSIRSTQYFTWIQVSDGIPDDWKIILKGNGEHITNDSDSSTSFDTVWINNRLGDAYKSTRKFQLDSLSILEYEGGDSLLFI